MAIENSHNQSDGSAVEIDCSTVENVAHLARLSIDKAEIETAAEKFSAILALIDEMQEVNTDGIVPLAHPLDHHQRLRPDEVTETNQREQLLAGAPATEEGLFLVPRVLE